MRSLASSSPSPKRLLVIVGVLAGVATTVVGISSCKDTTAPSLYYIRADITGAVEDTFKSGIQVTSWFHIRCGFDMYKLSGFDTRTRYYSVGGTQVESRRGIFLMGLDRNAFPQGEVPLQLLDPEDSTSSGWVAIYTQDSLRFVSQSGFIRPTEVTAETVAGTFEFHAFRSLDIYGHQRSPDGGIRSFHLRGLAHVSLPDGQGASLMELGPSSPEVTGFTAIYTQDGLRFAARRGVIRPTEVGDDVIAASFSLRMFLYCTGETLDPCPIPREPPEDAVWIEMEGEFRGDPFPG